MRFVLNFHGIGKVKRVYEEGEEPYWISCDQFSACLDLAEECRADCAITFDDGNDSDYEIAVPELRKRGLAATFFVLAGKLDQPGYLTSEQVSAIDAEPNCSIGSHGMDHQAWPDLNDPQLERELAASKEILSKLCNRPVEEVGLPFGRYDRRTLLRLREHGYRIIYSSDGSPRLGNSNPIPRYSVRKDTDLRALAQIMRNAGALLPRIKREATARLKALR